MFFGYNEVSGRPKRTAGPEKGDFYHGDEGSSSVETLVTTYRTSRWLTYTLKIEATGLSEMLVSTY
jgi:hypothetical protein